MKIFAKNINLFTLGNERCKVTTEFKRIEIFCPFHINAIIAKNSGIIDFFYINM